MALVMDLRHRDRDAVVEEAIFRSWDWWPDCPDGRLHHAVFCQLLKDLVMPGLHDDAVWELNAIDDHWWLEHASVNMRDIKSRLTEWAFIGPGKDVPVSLNPQAGKAWCSGCKKHLPVAEFRKVPAAASGLYSYCKPCGREKANKGRAARKAREQ